MNYEQMQNETEKYKDTMTDEERNKAYAEGKEVDPNSVFNAYYRIAS